MLWDKIEVGSFSGRRYPLWVDKKGEKTFLIIDVREPFNTKEFGEKLPIDIIPIEITDDGDIEVLQHPLTWLIPLPEPKDGKYIVGESSALGQLKQIQARRGLIVKVIVAGKKKSTRYTIEEIGELDEEDIKAIVEEAEAELPEEETEEEEKTKKKKLKRK